MQIAIIFAYVLKDGCSKHVNIIILYFQTRDVLPFTLKLPHAIATATTETKLEEVAQLGLSKYSVKDNLN